MIDQGHIAVGVFFIAIISFVATMMFIESRRCTKCGKLFSIQHTGRHLLEQWGGYETVTRYDITRDRRGNEISRTERKEQVHMLYYKYKNNCKCSACGYKWNYITTEKYQG
jgi:hypothetical protein